MKANKAPEKIYLYPSDRAGEEYENEWGAFPWGEHRNTLERYRKALKIRCGIRMTTGRKYYTGREIKRLWRGV